MASENESTVRVMTWNIHGGVGPDGRFDLARVVELVGRHSPDVVALQEVDSRRTTHGQKPAFEFLAASLGEHAAEARVITAPDGDYGHTVLSRWRMRDIRRHDVSHGRREARAVLETTIDTPFGDLHVLAAHLGLSFRERRQQAFQLATIAHRRSACCIVLGDFNDLFRHGSVQRALGRSMPNRTHHKTFPARWPVLALDRIYCRPANLLVRSWTDPLARHASDHLPLIADLEMRTGGE